VQGKQVMRQFGKYIQVLPGPLVRALRNSWLGVLDFRDRLRGLKDDLTPPRSLQRFVGGAEFKAVGNTFVGHFVKVCSLRPDEKILDIGCGSGRMAIPLLQYLDGSGSYVGFDISQKAIRWCQDHIASRDQRFSFFYADIYNQEYNPLGGTFATEYGFPC
jgi:SAM-dependent methyltransferase